MLRRTLLYLLCLWDFGKAFAPARIKERNAACQRIPFFPTRSLCCRSSSTSNDAIFLEQALQRKADEFVDLTIDELHRTLVQIGMTFDYTSALPMENQKSPDDIRASPLQRAPGCISNLKVQTILIKDHSSNLARLQIKGSSDSLLSRGLLAVVASCFKDQQVSQVMALNAASIADKLQLRRALSQGRNDGMASIVSTIQTQIANLLMDESDSTNTRDNIQQQETSSSSTTPTQTAPTAALLLSGGVDSSVALHLLKQQGYNVTAFYLKIWLEDELAHLGSHCPFEEDIQMCQAVCEQADVPFEQISLQQEYKDRVMSYTIEEASQGRTPNPDIMCNSRVKFGCFYDAIASRGFDHVATGHYARLVKDEETQRMRLLRAPDPVKDQSYFLCALSQEQLARVLFPIGHLQKAQVRELANEFELPNRHRPDSQGLCFLGKVKFDEFIAAYLGERPGDIIDAATGELLGKHRGVWYHTIGQRKGIGKVLFPVVTAQGPWYVVAKDPEKDLVLCSNKYEESVFTEARSACVVENLQWISGETPSCFPSCRFAMKIRHGPNLVSGSLDLDEDGQSGNIRLDQKDGGLAPGQFVVFYNDEECLGSGVISERHWAKFLLPIHAPSTTQPALKQAANQQ
jgi:tRNA-specific 2-thiouridylase